MTAAHATYPDQQTRANRSHSDCGSSFQCAMVIILGQGSVLLGSTSLSEVTLLKEMVTRRVSEGFSAFPSLTRRVTKQGQLLPATLVLLKRSNVA